MAGAGSRNFNGATATNDQWSAVGTWVKITHSTDSAIKLQGHGSGVIGINFICDQPVPSASWTPNTYGYCIERLTSHTLIENIMIVNASHGIYDHFTESSGGGTQCHTNNVIISAFTTRWRTSCVNDTLYVSNLHMRNLWYSSNALVVAHIRANTRGWHCGYTDNIMIHGLEFFEDAESIYFEDETCLGNTHSLYNAQIANVQFNLPQVCMKVSSTTTTVVAQISNLYAQTGNAFGYTWSDTAFQIESDNVDLQINGMRVREAGGVLMKIGNGTSGKIRISNLTVDNYSTVAAGQVCFSAKSGAALSLSNYRINKPINAGSRFAGAALDRFTTDAYSNVLFHGKFGEQTITGNGAYQDFSTSSLHRPGAAGAHQVRIAGEVNVTVASATTAMTIRLNGLTASVSGVDTTTTGWKSFDSGWLDITEAEYSALNALGRLQVNPANGVSISNGSTQVIVR